MAGEWESARVADVVNVSDFVANGSFESLRNNVTYRSKPDYAVLVRLVDHNSGWSGDFVYVDKASYDFLRKSSLEPGDIVIANVGANAGTVFRVPHLDTRMTLGPNAVLCRPRDENRLLREFLYYYLVSEVGQQSLQSILSGSAQPKFNKTDLRNLSVPVPPIPDQRAIAHILGTLDDKIELNRRMNETLEAMARALYKSWFVDFDPVRAKAGRRDPGLPTHISSFFPDTFEESALGEVPKGWSVSPFAGTVDIDGGGTPKTSIPAFWSGDIPWFSVVDAPRDADVWILDTVKKISLEGLENSSTKILAPGTTIISARGTVGRVGMTAVPMAMNQSCYGLRGKATSGRCYTYFSTRELVSRLRQNAHGSVFETITQDTLTSVSLPSPPSALIEIFESYAGPALERIRSNVVGSKALADLRDTLLPRLVSGEVGIIKTSPPGASSCADSAGQGALDEA